MVLKTIQHTQTVDKKISFFILLGLGRKKETPGEDCAYFLVLTFTDVIDTIAVSPAG